MELYNISNELSVLVSVAYNNAMLEFKGKFATRSLSANKTLFLLDNRAVLEKCIKYLENETTEKIFAIDESRAFIANVWQGNRMIQLHTSPNPKFNKNLSMNLCNIILSHEKELRKIIDENKVEKVQEKEINKAQKALKQNAATMPTDSKSAKESEPKPVQESAAATTGYKDGTLVSFVEWMCANYDVTKEQAREWIDDKEYNAEFSAYLESCKTKVRPQKRVAPTRPVKRLTVEQMAQGTEKMQESAKRIAELNAEIAQIESTGKLSPQSAAMAKRFESATGQKFDTAPKQKTKKGRGVPMSLSVMTKGGKTNFSRVESGLDAIRRLMGKELIHPQTKETDVVIDRGDNNSHQFATLVNKGYIFDVKRLDA